MQCIHQAALDALEEIGLADAPPSGIEIMTNAGAVLGDDGRIRFPRALVEDMLSLAARDITLCARDPAFDLDLSGSRVHYGTAGAAVHVVDVLTRDYRQSTAQDLYDAARLTQALDNIHFFQRAMVCRDIPDNYEMDVNTLYACCAGTTKHVGTSFSDPAHVPPELRHETGTLDECAVAVSPADWVLLHLSVGSPANEVFRSLPCRKASGLNQNLLYLNHPGDSRIEARGSSSPLERSFR